METFNGTRTGTGTYDLLIGGTSLIGGPQAFTARGDNDGGTGDGSFADQITSQSFTTGAAGDLNIQIAWDGTSDGAFVGVDNVTVAVAAVPEPASASIVGLSLGVLVLRRRKR